ncbi:hypothetical protein HanPSC8_Chr17g0795181 [Helianthus annuus]|nr:hypothetical protein HanLR1_Chr17g0685851 [Helianthus annuus]KAJ0815234.1 hypothetical protein HanPSC8_Chr17g0795181 [Helianthus annuus]
MHETIIFINADIRLEIRIHIRNFRYPIFGYPFEISDTDSDTNIHYQNFSDIRFLDVRKLDNPILNTPTLLHDIVYPILLLHQGPIPGFSLYIFRVDSCWEIDQIILHLSRNAVLKEFRLRTSSGDEHKLLPAFFKLQHLTVLELENCALQPSVTFKGFSRPDGITFHDVRITAEVFLWLISKCSLLKDFTLV